MLPVCNVMNHSINFLRTVTNFLFTLVALLEHEDGALSPKHAVQFMNAVNICVLGGLGGLEVACWPLVPKFAGSNTAEAIGFFRAKKSSARLPSEGK
jgi:hypothetical protein